MRWFLILPSAVIGFVMALILAIPLNRLIHIILWNTNRMMPGKMFIQYILPYDGALAAIFFILGGVIAAPSQKRQVALILLMVGGLLAWSMVGQWSPPFATKTPVRVWWPIIGTYLGGTCTYLGVVLKYKG